MERWVPIPGFEGRYEVSDLGRVRSLQLKGRQRSVPLVLRDYKAGAGYRFVSLFDGEEFTAMYVHRAVLLGFVGQPAPGMQGAHLDGSRTNNVLANLAWTTAAENHAHKRLHGTMVVGEAVSASKLTKAQVLEARRIFVPGHRHHGVTALAKRFGISPSSMGAAITGATWATLPGARMIDIECVAEQLRGENNPRARLSAADIATIRATCVAAGNSPAIKAEMAARFKVTRGYVNQIVAGRCWKVVAAQKKAA